MPSVCLYFQVHQPFRIRSRSYFDHSSGCAYFDDQKNNEIMRKVAHKCYLPTNERLLHLIARFGESFRVSYSLTGVALEQMAQATPEVIDSFQALADTGCVEFLGETFYHSLSAIYDEKEFLAQVRRHDDLMHQLFGVRPQIFRNTELIYDDRIGRIIAAQGYRGILAEGADDILGWRSPNFLYTVPGSDIRLLLKNYRLSDDIAFRFSNQAWHQYPMTADKFAGWVHGVSGAGQVINLFMDYETFGEHQWESTGIFQFLEHLPEAILRHPDWDFATPSQLVDRYEPAAELSYSRLTSWADVDRDLTAWCGNRMQQRALHEIYAIGDEVRRLADPAATETWRRLQTSDHFYYMCTKWSADGDVHAYFSPYESPYDAFVTFMNTMKDFRVSIERSTSPLAVLTDKPLRRAA